LLSSERWSPPGVGDLKYSYPIEEAQFKHPNPAEVLIPEYFNKLIWEDMEDNDLPLAYGQHINAEITS